MRIETARAMAKEGGKPQEHFTMSAHQDLGSGITIRALLELCLRENERRMALYDARLPRPRLAPALVRLACRVLRAVLTDNARAARQPRPDRCHQRDRHAIGSLGYRGERQYLR